MGFVARSRIAVVILAVLGVLFGVPTLAHATPGPISVVASPNPSGPAATNQLNGVSCVRASDCFAVGTAGVEHWNGKAWRIMAGSTGGLSGISCVRASDCFAVGGTTVAHWNGRRWTTTAVPNPSGAASSTLAAVSCWNARNCFAVGSYNNASGAMTLVEHWNGKAWRVMASPNGSGDAVNASWLYSVSCPSALSCFAVGYYYFIPDAIAPLIEHWNGKAWTIMDPSASYLNGVSCVSASDCEAVGDAAIGPSQGVTALHWNGIAWTAVAIPRPPASDPRASALSYLTAVSCVRSWNCYAVGYYNGFFSGIQTETLVEHWNGSTWTIVPSPNPSGASNSQLASVSCVRASCTAVGTSDGKSLVERWKA